MEDIRQSSLQQHLCDVKCHVLEESRVHSHCPILVRGLDPSLLTAAFSHHGFNFATSLLFSTFLFVRPFLFQPDPAS